MLIILMIVPQISIGQTSNNELLVKRAYLNEISPLKKSYRLGDKGYDVLRIKEWLYLWQLNENYVDKVIDLNQNFDQSTEDVLKEVQKFMRIEPTGIVDAKTWENLTSPYKKAFSLKSYNKSLREKVKYFATKHVQYRSSEIDEDNLGPWVRAYMDGHDGGWAYWCQGFACTILDQTFSSIGERFDLFYANTWACETFREHARKKNLLLSKEDLLNKVYHPKVGDIVLYFEGVSQKVHHTEIVYEILDSEKGTMLTIGGNTNFLGSRNGVGTFLVDRNYLLDNLEVVKLIDEETVEEIRQYPAGVKRLLISYPKHIVGYADNHLIFKDNQKLLYDDHIKKSTETLLTNPSIKDQFHYPYPKGRWGVASKPNVDPGRITNEAFFKTIYGATKKEVEEKLVEIVWCPKLSGEKVKVTTVNGVHEKLKAISKELDKHPELKPYVSNIGGTYKWRTVAGTKRLSLHSYGLAIDINVSQSNYWQWDCKCKEEQHQLEYTNRIPQLIVEIFEKNGFIWGGNWYHYDTMHFEYRPELLLK